MYGVPLKVGPPSMTTDQMAEAAALRRRMEALEQKLKEAGGKVGEQGADVGRELKRLRNELYELSNSDQRAALDSELALVRADDYPLFGWVPNPLFVGFNGQKRGICTDRVFLVSRLDGPDPGVVRRIIDGSLAVERRGLSGIAYFDARWPRPEDGKELAGYALYDKFLQAFPVPEVFFGLLVSGRLCLVECYALSLPFLSWQVVLIGDPLYRPFG